MAGRVCVWGGWVGAVNRTRHVQLLGQARRLPRPVPDPEQPHRRVCGREPKAVCRSVCSCRVPVATQGYEDEDLPRVRLPYLAGFLLVLRHW